MQLTIKMSHKKMKRPNVAESMAGPKRFSTVQCTDDDYDDDDNDDDDGADDKRYEITLNWCESKQHIVCSETVIKC